MSSTVVDTFETPWQEDPSTLWSLSASPSASHFGDEGVGMAITAQSGPVASPAPYAQVSFTPALDLSP